MHEFPHSAPNCCPTKTLRAPCPSLLPRELGWYSELRGREDAGNKVCLGGGVDIKIHPLSQSIALSIYLPSSLLYPKRWNGAMGHSRGQEQFLCLLEQQMEPASLLLCLPPHRYLPLSPSVPSCHELMLWVLWISDCILPSSVGSWLLPGDRLLGYTFTREIYATAT